MNYDYDDDSCEYCGGIDYHRAECPIAEERRFASGADDYEDEDGGWMTHRDDANDLWDSEPAPPADATPRAVEELTNSQADLQGKDLQ